MEKDKAPESKGATSGASSTSGSASSTSASSTSGASSTTGGSSVTGTITATSGKTTTSPVSASKNASLKKQAASDRSSASDASSSSASESESSRSESSASASTKGTEQRTQKEAVSYSAAHGNFAPSERMDRTQMERAGESKRETGAAAPTGPKLDKVDADAKKLIVMRGAERLDAVHPSFTLTAFTDMEKYKMNDLNMPVKLPTRSGGKKDYQLDPPITELGNSCSQLTGRGLLLNGIKLTHVFVSPALRCIQTAHRVLKAMNSETTQLKISIEPGLFEFLGWYEEMPNWLSVEELQAEGYPINAGYKPVYNTDNLLQNRKESIEQYYRRICDCVDALIGTNQDAKNILIIGHATTVDAGTRRLRRLDISPPSNDDIETLGDAYPFTSMVTVQQAGTGVWRHCHNPVPCITYVDFSNRIDIRVFGR